MNFATLLAFIAAMFGAPPLYGLTVPYVVQMLSRHYGSQFADLYDLLWMVLTFLLVFIPARAIFYFALTALISGALYRFI
ncbi:hypothetical protein [Rhodophyticola porphyridii]|nr:hypothetical protein [Rhodophyticola porphyridii]